ncbi:DNA cytosine methyltransferase [Massilia sp.]|uniref:DNA cytosine methyltransferase n=1 Tax=Massilia sp. TaxID=1882437 RepID=UPI00352BE3C2
MKRDAFTMQLDLGHELIIDNFAGGGGTSTGLEAAFGRPVDIAINHDPEALAMHAMNHPHTKHLCESVWEVDPIAVTRNQPVALVWLSPDCKHFSKAKGGAPVEKRIRGLAWVALRWAAKCKPRVIMLENVEEFKTWGPLIIDADGKARPDPAKRGKTFDSFVRQLRAHGYHVEWRELRACDFGAPTIRKRFFLVARRDGLPIQWPAPTHGAPTSAAVLAGLQAPHRTAAECIDWSLPCPSIFDRKRPLAEATMRRIAKGIMRYVVNAANPFIVNTANSKTTGRGPNVWPSDEPIRTVTSAPGFAVVSPTLVQTGYGERDGQAPRALDIERPLGTVVSGGKHALVSAFLNEHANASTQRVFAADEPMRTICGQVKGGHFGLVSATLVDAAHGEMSPDGVKRWGAGAKPVDEPLGTVTASGGKAVGVAFLAKHYTGVVGSELADPIGTITSTDHHSLVLAHVQRDMGRSVGHAADVPLATTTAGGGGKSAVVASTLVKLRGTSSTAPVDEPLHTVSAGGQHHAEVRAFLVKYYGADQDPRLEEPLHTVTTKDRFGLVTIQGVDYEIVDIGLRMLAPHELYLAQGFPADYVIEEIPDPALLFADGVQAAVDPLQLPRVPLTKSAQVRMCGNSVCPPVSEALIRANFVHEQQLTRAAA